MTRIEFQQLTLNNGSHAGAIIGIFRRSSFILFWFQNESVAAKSSLLKKETTLL